MYAHETDVSCTRHLKQLQSLSELQNLPVFMATTILRLKELVGQRDNEINILVNLLKKEKARQPSHDRQEVVVSPPPLRGTSQPSRVQKNLSQVRGDHFLVHLPTLKSTSLY